MTIAYYTVVRNVFRKKQQNELARGNSYHKLKSILVSRLCLDDRIKRSNSTADQEQTFIELSYPSLKLRYRRADLNLVLGYHQIDEYCLSLLEVFSGKRRRLELLSMFL